MRIFDSNGAISSNLVPAKSEGSTSNDSVEEGNPGLTTVSWSTVALAWRQWFLHERQRKEWIAHQRRKSAPNKESRTANQDSSDDAGPEVDEVIERVKSDPTLDNHEKRLLGCIVDTTTVPTTFANVHLPVKTVDAIRTMVSLPLLYPKAFTEGVLKSHSMTGALLLGPPGVGKTLLARAVARESGARMLMVKPSGKSMKPSLEHIADGLLRCHGHGKPLKVNIHPDSISLLEL